MGLRGPTPKGLKQAKVFGAEKNYETRLADVVPTGMPEPPTWLGEEEAALWSQLVAMMGQAGISFCEQDAIAVARYACDLIEWRRLHEQINQEGDVQRSASGHPQPHPAATLRNKAHDRMVKFEANFGMSPAARERITAEPIPDEDDVLSRMLV